MIVAVVSQVSKNYINIVSHFIYLTNLPQYNDTNTFDIVPVP